MVQSAPYHPLCSDQTERFRESALLLELGRLLIRRRMVVVPEPYRPASAENLAELVQALDQMETGIEENYCTRKDRVKSAFIRRFCVHQNETTRIDHRLLRIFAFMAAELIQEGSGWISVYEVARSASIDPLDAAEILEVRRVVATLAVEGALEVSETEGPLPMVALSKKALNLLLGGSLCVPDMSTQNIGALRQSKKQKALGQAAKPAVQPAQVSPKPDPASMASPRALFQYLKSVIVGQDEACKVLAIRGWLHIKRMELLKTGGNAGKNECILFAGPSGCGKTYLSETFGKCCGLPFASFTSTDATAVGFVGLDICEDSLKALMRSTGESQGKDAVARARYGILLLDEWSKKAAARPDIYGRDVSGTSVQQEVLRMMEGSKVILGARRAERDASSIEFDSNGTMFVFAGHMAGFDQLVKDLKRKKDGLGFSVLQAGGRRDAYVFDALVDYGFIPEWVNRLSAIAFFKHLRREDLAEIALLPDGPVASYNRVLQPQGLEIQIAGDGIRRMADLCIETGLMARGLRLLTSALVEEAVFEGRSGHVVFQAEDVARGMERIASLDDRATIDPGVVSQWQPATAGLPH